LLYKEDISRKAAKIAGVSKKDALSVIRATLEVIKEELKSGEKIQLTGFGIFSVKTIEEHEKTHPATREKIIVPEKRKLVFKASKHYGKALNA
jgi:DNA-binding protein HU-beta